MAFSSIECNAHAGCQQEAEQKRLAGMGSGARRSGRPEPFEATAGRGRGTPSPLCFDSPARCSSREAETGMRGSRGSPPETLGPGTDFRRVNRCGRYCWYSCGRGRTPGIRALGRAPRLRPFGRPPIRVCVRSWDRGRSCWPRTRIQGRARRASRSRLRQVARPSLFPRVRV